MPRQGFSYSLVRALCGAAAIGVMVVAAEIAATPLMWIPFASSIVLVLGSPETDAAQYHRVLGGHLICAASGVLCTQLFGFGPWVAVIAVGLAMLMMLRLDVFHPPAAATPIVIVATAASPLFILSPSLAGAMLLIGFSWICQRLSPEGQAGNSSENNQ